MRFPQLHVPDPMGESFSPQDFECLAYNISRMVKARTQPGSLRVVELGTWSGQSTLAIAQPHVLVHSLGSWETGEDQQKVHWLAGKLNRGDWSGSGNPAFQQFVTNTNGYVFRTVMPLICYPLDVSDWWPERLDAIFINGDACDQLLKLLISWWRKHVRSGGYIFGVYKDHTVAALTGMGTYTIDGTIWRLRVQGELP